MISKVEQLAANAAYEATPGADQGVSIEHLNSDEEWQAAREQMNALASEMMTSRLRPYANYAAAHAEQIEIKGPGGRLQIRLIHPEGQIRGVLLHCHGGGWVFCEPEAVDQVTGCMAKEAGLLVAVPAYRLAPQQPYPAACDDCEAAGLWLLGHIREIGLENMFIRGESAGGHLAIVTAMRLRRKHGHKALGVMVDVPLADFTNGAPSRPQGFAINTESCRQMADAFVPDAGKRNDPDVSPLYASVDDLRDMPPLFVVCGERDGFRDDGLLLFMRWLQSANEAFITVFNGVGHNLMMCDTEELSLAQALFTEFVKKFR